MTAPRLKIGDTAPDFKLKGIDGKEYSLSSFSENPALIIIFSCNHCPYVQAYEERIKELQEMYKSAGLRIAAINSNDDKSYPEDSFDNMKARGKEKNFNFPYLRDEEQSAAKAYGASHTPEIFLFNRERKLVYQGKIDDNWQYPEKVKSHYLKDAVDELLQDKEISIPETYSIGCTIKWKM